MIGLPRCHTAGDDMGCIRYFIIAAILFVIAFGFIGCEIAVNHMFGINHMRF